MPTELAIIPRPDPDPRPDPTAAALVPIPAGPDPAPPAVASPPPVRPADLFAALLADARKPTTRRAREQDVGDLARFLRDGGFLGEPDPSAACALLVSGDSARGNAIATAYRADLAARELSAATINRRLSTLRRVVKLGRRFGVIGWSIEVDSLESTPYRDTAGPGHTGWLRLLATAERAARSGTASGKRDLALIRLLHDLGLRRAEVAALDLAALDLAAGRLMVVGKGKTEPGPHKLNKPAALALADWIEARGPEPGPLFTRLDRARPRGELARLDGDAILEAVAALGEKAKLPGKVRPHGLRHEAVTRVLELTNGNIDAAQKFARHADPKTTQRYNDNRKDVAGDMAALLGRDA
jgi:integrase/recombinase XerC